MYDIPFPGYDSLTEEMREKPAMLLLSINDSEGNLIRNVSQKTLKRNRENCLGF